MKFFKKFLIYALVFSCIFVVVLYIAVHGFGVSPQTANDIIYIFILLLGIFLRASFYFPNINKDKEIGLSADKIDRRSVVLHANDSLLGQDQTTKNGKLSKGS